MAIYGLMTSDGRVFGTLCSVRKSVLSRAGPGGNASLVYAVQILASVENRSVSRAAGYGRAMVTRALPEVVGSTLPAQDNRSRQTCGRSRNTSPDTRHSERKSTLGRTTHPWGAEDAWNRRLRANRLADCSSVPRPPSQNWKTFLKNHGTEIMAIDFFTVPTFTFKVLFVFVVLARPETGSYRRPWRVWTERWACLVCRRELRNPNDRCEWTRPIVVQASGI